jgi:D-alanyl-D-alanine dipeptidase
MESEWQMVDRPTRIVIGRTGLAWGRGLHSEVPEGIPLKREGDGKSPAGVFRLGTGIGFAPRESMGQLKIPYTQVTPDLECVDDAKSENYNRMLRRGDVDTVDWNSSEQMIDYPTAYELGVFVEHNTDPVDNGRGSCIFLHVWSGPEGRTAGCTAMEKTDMESILYWLDAEKTPVLVQLTLSLYEKFRTPWALPEAAFDD